MEKFSNWRDKGTGISPFIASYPTTSPLCYPILLLKLPVLLVLSLLIIFPPIKNFIMKFLFNFTIKFAKLNTSTVYVTNYSSPLLVFLTNLPILIPTNNEIYRFSTFQFILHALGYQTQGCKVEVINFGCILLIEGTTSNNKSILKFEKFNTPITSKLGTLIIKFQPNWVNTPLPVNPIGFLWGLLNLDQKSIIMKSIVHGEDLDRVKRDFNNANLKMVNFDKFDKQEFYKYKLDNE